MKIKRIVVGSLKTNCYLLVSQGEIMIVDPGAEADKIMEEVKKEKGEVRYIINTHSHPDHVSANKETQKETGAQIINNLKEGDEIKIGEDTLRVLHTPGHTNDSICLMGEGFLLSGDTLFYQGYGRTDLPGGSEEKMKNSLKRLSDEIPPNFIIYPGHGESFKRGVESLEMLC